LGRFSYLNLHYAGTEEHPNGWRLDLVVVVAGQTKIVSLLFDFHGDRRYGIRLYLSIYFYMYMYICMCVLHVCSEHSFIVFAGLWRITAAAPFSPVTVSFCV
jgi:cbb3-type cytochrome oxidase subunit 1